MVSVKGMPLGAENVFLEVIGDCREGDKGRRKMRMTEGRRSNQISAVQNQTLSPDTIFAYVKADIPTSM